MASDAERFLCPACGAELQAAEPRWLEDSDAILNYASSTVYTCQGCGGAFHRLLILRYPKNVERWSCIEQDRHVPLDTGQTPRLAP